MSIFRLSIATLAVFIFSACGGGGGGSTGSSSNDINLSGVAATGAAISNGKVEAKCKKGTGSATSNADGSYELKVTNGVGPCMLKAVDPNTNTTLYSFVELGASAANINPVTHLVVANVLNDDPSTAFSGFSESISTKITYSTISTGIINVRAATAVLGKDGDMSEVDFMKGSMKAATGNQAGDSTDKKIDALMASLIASNKKITDLASQIKLVKSEKEAANKMNDVVGNAKIALEGCPYARSGKIWALDIYGGDPVGYDMDFRTDDMKMKRLSTNTSFDISLKKDLSNKVIPCAFTSNISGNELEIRVSEGGIGAWAMASSKHFGVTVPQQTNSSLSDTNFAGTYPAMAFLNNVTYGQLAFPMKFVIDSTGKMNAYTCDTSKSNAALDCNIENSSQNLDTATCSIEDGIYTCTYQSGGSAKAVLYATGNQTTLFMTVNNIVAGPNTLSGLIAMTKLTPTIFPIVGREMPKEWNARTYYSTGNINSLTMSSGDSGAIKVLSVSPQTNSFTYQYSPIEVNFEPITLTWYQNPKNGFSLATSDDKKFISISIVSPTGWELSADQDKSFETTKFNNFAIYIRTKR